MQLELVDTTSCLSIYYDAHQEVLSLEWRGELTLPIVQEACVTVAQYYLARPYSRVLSSKLQVSKVGSQVGTWLGVEFLPYLAITGVEQLAWVSNASLARRSQVQSVVNRMPTLDLRLFDTTEEATAWLLGARLSQAKECVGASQQPDTPARFAQGVQLLREEGQLIRQEVQQLKQKVGWKPVKSWQA